MSGHSTTRPVASPDVVGGENGALEQYVICEQKAWHKGQELFHNSVETEEGGRAPHRRPGGQASPVTPAQSFWAWQTAEARPARFRLARYGGRLGWTRLAGDSAAPDVSPSWIRHGG